MTLSKAEQAKRDLERRLEGAVGEGRPFAVRYELDGKSHDPPSTFPTLAEAQAEANTIFGRLNTAEGAAVHARPDNMKRVGLWIEHFTQGAWTRVDGSVRDGFLDTHQRRS